MPGNKGFRPLYERTTISDEKNKLFIARNPGEFLDVPSDHKEKELRRAIVAQLKDFILEFDRNFSFMGEEYRVQVGNTDFAIDLLFYNRSLSCLVVIEL